MKLAKGEDTGVKATMSDGTYDVPSYQFSPVLVDPENIDQVISRGWLPVRKKKSISDEKAN